MCQANFLKMTMMAPLLRPSSVSMATSMEIAFNHSFCIRSFLSGSQGGASSSEASPDLMDSWNQHAKLGPFFHFFSFSGFEIHCRREVTWSNVSQVLRTRANKFFLSVISNLIVDSYVNPSRALTRRFHHSYMYLGQNSARLTSLRSSIHT